MAVCIDINPWILFEYMENGNLYDWIHNSGNKVNRIECINMTLEIAQGMSFLHQSNIIHCDLKSSNILLGNHGVRVK